MFDRSRELGENLLAKGISPTFDPKIEEPESPIISSFDVFDWKQYLMR